MLRTVICLMILVLIIPLVCSSGYISNQTVGESLIINGGTNLSKLNNNTLSVCTDGCSYSSIQSAIHAAIPWSIIEVQSGSYDENFGITKPLFFKSVGGSVDYRGTIMPFHYPVTFSGKNHFVSVDLNSPPWHQRCKACESYKEFSECYQGFVDVDPSNAMIWRDYAVDQKEIWQKYEDALASLARALQIDPRFSEAWEIKGILLNKLGRYQDAISSCERAIELDRLNDGAWTEKGFAFYQMKSYEKANRSLIAALAINPKNSQAWGSKGYLLCLQDRFDESYRSYEEAIRIDPMNAQYWNNMGYCLDKLGRYDEALEAYEEALKIEPNYGIAWDNKGRALKKLGQVVEANAAFAKARELENTGRSRNF